MKSENIFCPKCGSKQEGNDFCSKCGNNLIVNTHKQEPKNQKEFIPQQVVEENSIWHICQLPRRHHFHDF